MSINLYSRSRKLMARSDFTEELEEVSAWMSDQGYTRLMIHRRLIRLNEALPRLAQHDTPSVHRLADLESVFKEDGRSAQVAKYLRAARRDYARFLRAQERLIEPSSSRDPYRELKRDYAHFLAEVRGLSHSTRTRHSRYISKFLVHAVGSPRALRRLTPLDVERFIAVRSRLVSRSSLLSEVGVLRAFLRYCHDRGHVASRVYEHIDTPVTYRGELLPRALPWETVQALLESIDRHSKAGWRDYTILHLLAHYGLRPSEVVSLRRDSIDWDHATLHVTQFKTGSDLLLPLASSTVQILREFLERDRAAHGWAFPELFLAVTWPRGPLTRYAISDLFEKRMRLAGLPSAKGGVYRLRHSLAMRLLTRGVGVKAIADVLGHHYLESTCNYLRLDIGALREVVLEVPGVSEIQGGRHADT